MTRNCEKVAISGLLTVGTVGAGSAALLAAFERSGEISVEVSPQSADDIAGIQLLESARLYAALNDKRIELAAPAAGGLREILQLGGFLEDASEERRRFWLHEEAAQ